MTRPKILLDPDDFDALHLSALEFGGLRALPSDDPVNDPWCKWDHADWLDIGMNNRLCAAGLTCMTHDRAFDGRPAGKIAFEEYIELFNIDISDAPRRDKEITD